MRVLLIGLYPGEEFGLAPLVLKAACLARPALQGVDIAVRFYSRSEGEGVIDEVGYPVERILEEALEERPDVIGLGCYLWNREAVLELSCRIKQETPSIVTVVGGPEVETREAANSVLREGAFDYAVRGEGEVTFPEVLEALLASPLVSLKVHGLSRMDDGRVVHAWDRTPIDPLDEAPTPFNFQVHDYKNLNRIPCFETYRGCKMHCKFCNWGAARGMRYFSLERIERDLRFILALDIERVWFVDSVFNLNGERYKYVLRFLAEENRRGIRFDFEMMAELLDDEGIDLIARLPEGSSIAFGLQSTDHGVLRTAARPHNWQAFSRVIRRVRERAPHVRVAIDLIFGLPGDRPALFRKSLLQAVDLNPSRIQVHPFHVLVGTAFYDEKEKFGFRTVGHGETALSAAHDLSDSDVNEMRWIAYWVSVYHGPRQHRFLEDLHRSSGVARSTLLESFMEAYENVMGKTSYFDPALNRQRWRRDIDQVHSLMRTRFLRAEVR